ncbi:hypothetical protein [Natronospira bacteriovora]|uniref:Uncharacterized protein n=1 Tax=Natronospira bacteriovora TaxID=3069753 RepID=A0ABU0WAC5_9GAMM|nr:hypothetical protein [Natronospira sp. AB-CW4]MDQ2070883.1 hypothetical protein [Natronospira sp. AB-CW4]
MSNSDGAVAALIAVGMADGAEGFIEDPNLDDDGPGSMALHAANGTATNQCSGTGHLYIDESVVSGSSVGLDSAFGYTGNIELLEVDADCVISHDSFTVESRGYMRFGHSPDHTVVFGELTPGPGQSADAGPYISVLDSGATSMDQASQMYIHICQGCPELGGGANARMLLFADINFDIRMQNQPDMDFHLRWGTSTSDRMHMEVTDLGADNREYQMNGFMGFDSGSQSCQFAATFDTVQPIVVQGASSGQPMATAGELHLTPESGGDTVEVVYHSDGSVTVNGQTFSQSEVEALFEGCDSDV